jgi:thiamine-phosphate pyrophosphorylase
MLHGLYAVTPEELAGEALLAACHQVLQGGARVLQYRNKAGIAAIRRRDALRLRTLCHGHDAVFIVNDDVELAAEVGADGVHLGRDDPGVHTARQQLGERAVIGVSCYNELHRARAAIADGADYLAFGRFFASRTKPGAVLADPALLAEARRITRLPLVAIGGITPENGRVLLEHGADMLAVVHALFAAADLAQRARTFADLFPQQEDSRS